MPLKVIELFESWQGKFGRHCNIYFWRLVPHCLMWCIWREKNARCFQGYERSFLEIKSFFFHTLFVWSVALSHFSFLFFLFLFYLIIVILVLDFCPQSTSPMYSGWLFFFLIKFFIIYQKKKKKPPIPAKHKLSSIIRLRLSNPAKSTKLYQDSTIKHCTAAFDLWSFVFIYFGIQWVWS